MNKKDIKKLYGHLSLQQLQQEYVRAQSSQDHMSMTDISAAIKLKQADLNNSPF